MLSGLSITRVPSPLLGGGSSPAPLKGLPPACPSAQLLLPGQTPREPSVVTQRGGTVLEGPQVLVQYNGTPESDSTVS